MIGRREFLRSAAGGFAGLALRHGAAEALAAPGAGPATSCIILWMDGGPSQIDTFDPKPGRPTGGSFGAIPTAVPGVRVSEHLSRTARIMDRLSVVRSLTSKEQDHGGASVLVRSGFAPTAAVRHPSLGSLLTYERPGAAGVPAYVSLKSSLGIAMGVDPGPGFLGARHSSFVIDQPENARSTLDPLHGDFEERFRLLEEVNRGFRPAAGREPLDRRKQFLALARQLKDSPFEKVLDLRDEDETTVAGYLGDNEGKTLRSFGVEASAAQFGYGCLLARRLVESGTRCVEVNLGGWDTHVDNFRQTRNLLQAVDPALAFLVTDLERRGLLETTLILWMGEFGRTPSINSLNGRDHYSQAFTAVLGGGGLRGGRVVGETDADGRTILKDPVRIPDLLATVLSCFGIEPHRKYTSAEAGTVRATDGGVPLRALLGG